MDIHEVNALDLEPISKRGKQLVREHGRFAFVNHAMDRMPCFNHKPGFNVTFANKINGEHTRNVALEGDPNFRITRTIMKG